MSAVLERRRAGGGVGGWGIAMVIASEATLFGTFVGTYFYLRFRAGHWPPLGTPEPRVVVPLILVGVLTAAAGPTWLAAQAAGAGRLAATRAWLLLALVVQSGYFAYEVHDYLDQLQRSRPQDSAYASIYYVLLGADHAHVAFGLLLSLWLLAKLATGLTVYRIRAARVVAWYWLAVVVLTWLVLGTLLSAALA